MPNMHEPQPRGASQSNDHGMGDSVEAGMRSGKGLVDLRGLVKVVWVELSPAPRNAGPFGLLAIDAPYPCPPCREAAAW